MPILVCLQKKVERFPDYQGDLKRNFSSRTDVFLKSQLFSKSTLNLARFDTKLVAVRKVLLSALWQGSLGSTVLKLSLYPALTMKARMKIAVDVAVTINQCSSRKSTSNAQVFKTVKFSIDFIQGS